MKSEILFVGDLHGCHFDYVNTIALEVKPKAIVLLGDISAEKPLLEYFKPCRKARIKVYWVMGNHDEQWEIAGRWVCKYLPKQFGLHGKVTEIAGLRVAGFGMCGVSSGQRCFYEDYEYLLTQKADILVTHDAPVTPEKWFNFLSWCKDKDLPTDYYEPWGDWNKHNSKSSTYKDLNPQVRKKYEKAMGHYVPREMVNFLEAEKAKGQDLPYFGSIVWERFNSKINPDIVKRYFEILNNYDEHCGYSHKGNPQINELAKALGVKYIFHGHYIDVEYQYYMKKIKCLSTCVGDNRPVRIYNELGKKVAG